MADKKVLSRYTIEALILLGKRIQFGRKQRRWSESELASRAGISRATLQKIERGDPGASVGTVFELAALVGEVLFEPEVRGLKARINAVDDKLAILPQKIRKPKHSFDDF